MQLRPKRRRSSALFGFLPFDDEDEDDDDEEDEDDDDDDSGGSDAGEVLRYELCIINWFYAVTAKVLSIM